MLIDPLLSRLTFGVDIGLDVARQQLALRLISEHTNQGGINLQELAALSHTIDSIGSVLHQGSETGLGAQELLLNAAALGDVSRDGGSTHDLSAGVMNRGKGKRHNNFLAIFAQASGFMVFDFFAAGESLE